MKNDEPTFGVAGEADNFRIADALFSGLPQLPIPLGMDLPLTPGEHVLRRDVADGNQYENGGFTSSAGDDPGGPS